MDKRIYLCLAHMSGKEQAFIKEAFDTNWVVPLGPNVNAFEDELKHFVGQDKEVVALSAGTAAIHLGLIQLGVGAGDEVICQSFTFCASANPVAYQGAKPVFVDSEEDTWNMDPVLLEEAIKDRILKTGKKPKAILPVHLYGMPARIDEICAIAAKYDIPDNFFIDPFGDVFPCNGLEEKYWKKSMGNIHETPDFMTIWTSKKAEEVLAKNFLIIVIIPRLLIARVLFLSL